LQRSKLVCPECGSEKVYQCRSRLWLRCPDCGATFLLTRIKMRHIPLAAEGCECLGAE